ncbi:MAG: ABC transporter permease [Chloroflexi bacterium]|nr:ABC transporter permease [Chloroflexota bacterium]
MNRPLVYDSHQAHIVALDELLALLDYKELLKNLVARDLKVRYKRSVLGFFWTMLNPLLMMIVFTVVFSVFLRFSVANFVIYFLSAYLLWNFFAQSTVASMTSILRGGTLIEKIYVPKAIFVLATITSVLVNLLFAMLPLLVVMVMIQQKVGFSLLFLPIPVILTALFTLGLSLLLSAVAVFFYDVIEMYQVMLTAWMYLTPIFYPIDIIPPQYRVFIRLNPMYYLVECFRAPIYDGVLPPTEYLAYGGLAALVALIVGWWFFSRSADRFVYYV